MIGGNLFEDITFIVGTRDFRVPLYIFENNKINIQDLLAEAETLSPTIIISLENVSYATFKKIERFLIDPEEPQQLLYTLNEVLDIATLCQSCPPLEVISHAFIYEHLSPESALAILAKSDELLQGPNKFLLKLAKDYCSSKRLSTLESEVILKMYTGDLKKCVETFRDDPYHLFVMLMKRAKYESEKEGVPARSVIFEYLPQIDFLSMTVKDFMAGPIDSDVLTDSEKLSILANINQPGSLQLPYWCSTRKKRNGEQGFSVDFCKCPVNYSDSDVVKSPFICVADFFPEERNVMLLGIEFHPLHKIHSSDYAEATLHVTSGNIGSSAKLETKIPFPPKSTYLQIPGNLVIVKSTTCRISVTVSEVGLELFSCCRNNASPSKSRVSLNGFSCTCNLAAGAAHIKKIYLKKC